MSILYGVIVGMILLLIVTVWRRRESFRSCAGIRDCPKSATAGNVLNPFVWPFSGSSNFDETLPKARLDLENFSSGKPEKFSDDMEMQVETANDHGLRSLIQESDHDAPSA